MSRSVSMKKRRAEEPVAVAVQKQPKKNALKKKEKKAAKKQAKKEKKQRKLAKLLVSINAILYNMSGTIPLFDDAPEFEPNIECVNCQSRLVRDDVLSEALSSPYDITTRCKKCNTRFPLPMAMILEGEKAFVPWLCRVQTRDQYRGWLRDSKSYLLFGEEHAEHLCEDRPDIYWNAYRYATEDEPNSKHTVPQQVLRFFKNDD